MIRAMIREVLSTTDLTSPRDVAAEVLNRLSPEDHAVALGEILPSFVQTTFSRSRLLAGGSGSAAVGAAPTTSRVTAARDAWAEQKATPLLVGDTWKRLGECTAEDLIVVSTAMRERARAVIAKAQWYEKLAASLPPGATVDTLEERPE